MSHPYRFAITFFATLALSACATQEPRVAQTPSGQPEVTIHTSNVGLVKSKLLSEALNAGWTLIQDSTFRLSFERPATGSDALLLGLAIGNAYSTPPVLHLDYTIAPIGPNVRVLAGTSASTQMALGQTNSMALTGNRLWNLYFNYLTEVKRQIEHPSNSN